MNDQTRFQVDVMQVYSKIKNEYLELKAKNVNLVEKIEQLKERITRKEQQKSDLITLFKNVINQKQEKIESLRNEKNHLQIRIQEKNQTINEYLNIIHELKKQLANVSEKSTNDYYDKQMYLSSPIISPHKNNKLHDLEIKDNNNINSNHFTHPSFIIDETTSHKTRTKPKKTRIGSNFRWPNLDIMVNDGIKIEKEINHVNNITTNNESNLFKFEKRRKLYCPDDVTVDLENEED